MVVMQRWCWWNWPGKVVEMKVKYCSCYSLVPENTSENNSKEILVKKTDQVSQNPTYLDKCFGR